MENKLYEKTRVFIIPEYQEDVIYLDNDGIVGGDVTVKRAEAFLKGIKDEVPLNRNSLRYMAESSEGFRRMLCAYNLPSEYKNLDFTKVKTEFPSFGRGGEKDVRYDLLMSSEEDNVIAEAEAQYTRECVKMSKKRARFYMSRLTTASLKDGGKYEDLPDVIVIYLLNRDIMKEGRPFYTFRMKEDLNNRALSDYGEILVFVNLTYRGDDEYGRAAHDFNTKDVKEMNEGAIRDSMEKVKGEDREDNMRTAVDYAALMQKDGFDKGVKYGQKTGYSKGATEEKNITIERMLRSGECSVEQIARWTSTTVDKVNEVATKLGL